MIPTVSRLTSEYDGRVDFARVNISDASSKAAKDKYRFIGQPQFVIVSVDGTVIASRGGYQEYKTLKADLDKALQKP